MEGAGASDEVKGLHRCITDLVSVLALPAMWSGAEPARIVDTLLDALTRMLFLELAYVRLQRPVGDAPRETLRLAHSGTAAMRELVDALNRRLGDDPQTWPLALQQAIDGAELTVVPLPLGLRAELGVLLVGSERAGFPTQAERLLLGVAANQAAVGLREAWILSEHKRVRVELSQGVAFREQLMGILGHDLRTPLSAVRGIADFLLLEHSPTPEDLQDGLSRIKHAGERMAEMIETILDFTRIRFEDRGLPVSRSAMDLGDLCRAVVAEAQAANPGRRISLERAGDLSGSWDYARLAQVASNLVGNALTHGDGEQVVRVSVSSDASSAAFAVINHGPTLAAEQLPALFEPFVRGAGDGAARRRGLGLGLYISKQIVASHGGTLTATSRDGITTFRVVLPR